MRLRWSKLKTCVEIIVFGRLCYFYGNWVGGDDIYVNENISKRMFLTNVSMWWWGRNE